MIIGKVSKKGQIVIPKEIREKLKINQGDSLIFKIEGNKIILQKVNESIVDILEDSTPFSENSLEYQKRLRSEWD